MGDMTVYARTVARHGQREAAGVAVTRRRGVDGTSLFRDRSFRTYWSGQAAAVTGTAVVPVALGLVAALTLEASGLEASLVSASALLPALLLTLPIGAAVDRLPKRRTMMWADVLESLALWIVPALWWGGLLSIPALCAVGFAATSFGIVSQVAHLSLTPYLVRPERLIDANSKLSIADSAAAATGPALAGLLAGRLGAPVAVGIGAVGSLFSALTLARLRVVEPPIGRRERERGLGRAIAAGLRFVWRSRTLRTLMIITATDNYFLAWIHAVTLVYLVQSLGWSAQEVGLVAGVAALGGLLGSLVVLRLDERLGSGRLLVVAVLAGGPAESMILLLEPGSRGLVLMTLGQFVALFAEVCYNVTSRTIRQQESPEGMRSRITAAHRWVGNGLRPLGAVTGGLATAAWDLRTALAIGCAGLLVAPLVAWLSSLADVDTTRTAPPRGDLSPPRLRRPRGGTHR